MNRFLLFCLLAGCAGPTAAQPFGGHALGDELTALFYLRREPPALSATIAAAGYRQRYARPGYTAFTRGTDTLMLRMKDGVVTSISYHTPRTGTYGRETARWARLGHDGQSEGRLADAGPQNIYWIFGLRYPRRLVFTISESLDYSKAVEDELLSN
ncbi:MAG: hypothetical protein EOO11_21420 [Chitinophagaceae bacterium]|nr:MAG: hypothetical protein EOO11_21420 [Chitinophagaceae bacterium]